MSGYILDKAYRISQSGGVGSYLVVVQGTNAGEAKLPAANAAGILGVTVHSQLNGANVAVRKAGIAKVTAAGPVKPGDPVCVADNSGRIAPCEEIAKKIRDEVCAIKGEELRTVMYRINCLGFAETGAESVGDICEVFISLHERLG